MKPPTKPETQPKKRTKDNDNEGMEGTADEETPFPHKAEVHCKVCKPSGLPTKRARADNRQVKLASVRARAAGDFDTQCMQERQDIIAIANKTSVARMFFSMGLNKIVDAIVDELGYNNP